MTASYLHPQWPMHFLLGSQSIFKGSRCSRGWNHDSFTEFGGPRTRKLTVIIRLRVPPHHTHTHKYLNKLGFKWNVRDIHCFKIFIYPSFSFWCLGVISFWSGVLRRHFWPHTGVDVRAGLSRFKCSAPDMLQNWDRQQTGKTS